MMIRSFAAAVLLLAAPSALSSAHAQQGPTVQCMSRDNHYDECFAGPLRQPHLVFQESSSPCIVNKTWGYNPKSRYIWVAQGCRGVFADVGGYHHGRGDTFDHNARMYDHHGHDTGAMVAGVVLGAIIAGAADRHSHTISNHRDHGGYNGCHGAGCLVDDPDAGIDPRPQFDRQGFPNFDVHGNYQGCHGVGCLADNPDDPN
ncbi:DUF3011 domain-containing protein [Mesorhizobium retamae]|uniref:DUF3011 domain-containing protein n=1 Tax=Mesorhizobium retamae TaxID=2912854 RepID=A0ABS9QNP4_9HYPH|nr:DUF3011 domain-containing protein [Mesorhizobium sp. IRAMC:0171]MCG7509062.1 DUF3011 domain-containing protein [Mesorhizobium sp. IRAMC:0171]